MERLIQRARLVAVRTVPVLIEGESGTGKEMLARAIHRASPRRDCTFLAVNCGAIPGELLESELFGHEKGAFTGAHRRAKAISRPQMAERFSLTRSAIYQWTAQVKLLRVVQEGEVVRVGARQPIRSMYASSLQRIER